MALVLNTGTTNATTIDANFDDATAAILANSTAGRKDHVWQWRRLALAIADDVSLRQTIFISPDDLEVRTLRVLAVDTAGGPTVTASIVSVDEATVVPGDYIGGQLISVTVTAIAGTVRGDLDMRTTTQPKRVRLLKGVRYALRLASSGAAVDRCQAAAVMRTIRRRS